MKAFSLLCLLATPVSAWEFSATPICTLTHTASAGDVTVTYDPITEDYAIALRLRSSTWPDSPTFGMTFLGSDPRQIGTSRHELSEDRTVLTVRDRGFGNVLDGLEFNSVAVAQAGDLGFEFQLLGAADPVAQFRECDAVILS